MPEQALRHVRADDADKADNAEARHARRRHQRGEQQREKAQARNVHAHAARGGVAAQKGVIPPRERGENRQPRRRGAEHKKIGLICRAAQIAEVPHDRGGKADVGGVKLQERRRRRPDRADGDAREHHNIRRERLHAAERENEQNGKRREEERRHARGERVHPGGIAGKVVPRGEKASGEHDNGEVRAEHGGVGYAHRGGRSHGVGERRLHDEAGDGERRAGNERGKHARHADRADNAHVGGGAFSEQGGDAVRKAHARRADEKTDERHDEHRERERGDNMPGAGLCFHGRSLLSSFSRTARLRAAPLLCIIKPLSPGGKPPGGIKSFSF